MKTRSSEVRPDCVADVPEELSQGGIVPLEQGRERVPPGLRCDLEHLLEETVDAGVTRFVSGSSRRGRGVMLRRSAADIALDAGGGWPRCSVANHPGQPGGLTGSTLIDD